jgi:hypothetical protein
LQTVVPKTSELPVFLLRHHEMKGTAHADRLRF